MKRTISILFLSGLMSWSVSAQDFKMPAPSPSVSIQQDFSTSFIKLDYSRPSVKERKIFGELIPFGQIWRTGANATTKITFGEEVYVGNELVKPGTYSLYTIPGEKEWTVLLNTDLDNWGADGYDEAKNVVKMSVPVKVIKNQETFSVTVENMTPNSAHIVLAWEKAAIEIPVKADNHDRIMEHLKMAMEGKNPPYMRAASYYLANNVNLEDALKYMELAIKENPNAYYMYWTKARILEKLGRNDEALQSAKTSAEMAKKTSEAFAHEYKRNLEEMQKRLKK